MWVRHAIIAFPFLAFTVTFAPSATADLVTPFPDLSTVAYAYTDSGTPPIMTEDSQTKGIPGPLVPLPLTVVATSSQPPTSAVTSVEVEANQIEWNSTLVCGSGVSAIANSGTNFSNGTTFHVDRPTQYTVEGTLTGTDFNGNLRMSVHLLDVDSLQTLLGAQESHGSPSGIFGSPQTETLVFGTPSSGSFTGQLEPGTKYSMTTTAHIRNSNTTPANGNGSIRIILTPLTSTPTYDAAFFTPGTVNAVLLGGSASTGGVDVDLIETGTSTISVLYEVFDAGTASSELPDYGLIASALLGFSTIQAWDIGYESATPSGTATVTLGYEESLLNGLESEIQIYHHDGAEWVVAPIVGQNLVANTVTVETNSFSPFVIGVPAAELVPVLGRPGPALLAGLLLVVAAIQLGVLSRQRLNRPRF